MTVTKLRDFCEILITGGKGDLLITGNLTGENTDQNTVAKFHLPDRDWETVIS